MNKSDIEQKKYFIFLKEKLKVQKSIRVKCY